MNRQTDRAAGRITYSRLHNNDFFSTVQPACLLICGRGWLRDNTNTPCAAEQLLHERILLPWQGRGRERWRGLSCDRGAVLQLKKRGFYTFAERGERGNNRWVSCLQFSAPNQTSSENYTVQPVAMESGQAWDRSTPTYMCSGSLLMPLFMFFLLHFLLHNQYSTHQGTRLNVLSPLFPIGYVPVWDVRKAQIACLPRENCLSAPCWMSGFPRGRQRGFEIILCFGASAVLCSAH